MRAVNASRNVVLVERGNVASSPWARMKGLLGHAPLQPGEGLLLRGEKAIHTFGMGFPIDILFLDRSGCIVKLYHAMAPLRASPLVWHAENVLELPAGTLVQTGTGLGDRITFDF